MEGLLEAQSTMWVVGIMVENEVRCAYIMPTQTCPMGGNGVLSIPRCPALCLHCKKTCHVQRECQIPGCSRCQQVSGHAALGCVITYAIVTRR